MNYPVVTITLEEYNKLLKIKEGIEDKPFLIIRSVYEIRDFIYEGCNLDEFHQKLVDELNELDNQKNKCANELINAKEQLQILNSELNSLKEEFKGRTGLFRRI